jgi:hypothetical protein
MGEVEMTKQLEMDLALPIKTISPKLIPERLWLEWAASEWSAFHGGQQMTIRWARDIALIRPLLRQHGDKEIKARWGAFIRTMDEYFARKGWDIPSFSACIDRYCGSRDLVPIVRRRQLLEAEENDRDPITGVNLRFRYR